QKFSVKFAYFCNFFIVYGKMQKWSNFMIENEEDIISLIQEDKWMMDVLKNAKSLHLSDWWICAGFVRSKIWDIMHGLNEKTPLPDVDVIYYDSSNIRETKDKKLEGKLYSRAPSIPWS